MVQLEPKWAVDYQAWHKFIYCKFTLFKFKFWNVLREIHSKLFNTIEKNGFPCNGFKKGWAQKLRLLDILKKFRSIIFDFVYCQQCQEQVAESFPIFRVPHEAQFVRAANKFRLVLTHKPRIVIAVIRVALNFM